MAPETDTSTVPLYFAFPDGALNYVCAECTALCCRGQGFAGSLRREMQPLLRLYPALGSAAMSRKGSVITFAAPAGRCHFLDSDNLCRIEKKHGKALKPGVCTLFPFNSFARIGKTIAVSPHYMCPLRLQIPAQPGRVEGTHSRVEAAVRESALLEPAYIQTHVPEIRLHPSEKAESAIAREERFRDACSLALGTIRFLDLVTAESANPHAIERFLARALGILGYVAPPPPETRDLVDDVLLVLAPSLRLQVLQVDREGALRVLALGEIVLRRILSLSPALPTPQGAYQILGSVMPALRLLARDNEPVELKRRAGIKIPAFGDAELTFAAYGALREIQNGAGVLHAIERTFKPSLSPVDRSVLLAQLWYWIQGSATTRDRR